MKLKQLKLVYTSQEKAERVICCASLNHHLRWRKYDTVDEEGYLHPTYIIWYTPLKEM